ncbi:MAG: three-Cys-motif partner protein TcmP [Pirellulaceae bacterium]|nr:three-Cys-motif partner protein TcmP [Pirellulaceae bacterium]
MYESEHNPRSLEALIKLDRFLNVYTENLERKVWCRRYHYIDAFAGPGTRVSADNDTVLNESDSLIAIAEHGQNQLEHIEFTRHSPNTAVRIDRPFGSYTFIEQSLRRNHVLEEISKEFKGLKIRVVRESCSTYLRRLSLRTEWKSQRALLFLDPFRMLINWETLALMAQTKAIEIMLNFPAGVALQKRIPHDSTSLNSTRRGCLDRFFGSTEWFDLVYSANAPSEASRATERPPNFSPPTMLTSPIRSMDPGRRLASWYRQRLMSVFGAVSKPYLVRNNNQGQLYYLMFAAHRTSSVELAQSFLELGSADC